MMQISDYSGLIASDIQTYIWEQAMPGQSMRQDLRMVITLSTFVFLVMMGLSLISPILPLYAMEFGASVFMVSMLVAGFAITRMLLDLPAGLLGSRYHPKSLMLFGLAMISGSSVLCAFAPNYWVLLAGRVIEGAGSGFYTTMSTTLLVMSVPPSNRGKYMSIFTSMLLLGGITGPGVGGLIASVWGLRAPFLFYALVTAIGFLLVLTFIERSAVPRAAERITISDLKNVVKEPSVLLVNVATFSLFFARSGVTSTVVPLFAYKNLHITEAVLGGILTFTALSTFITMTPSGTYTDRHGRRRSMMACLMLTGLFTVLIPFAGDYWSFVAVMTAYGLTLGLSGPLAAWMSDLVPKESLGPAMGLFRTINDAGMFAGPLVLGSVAGATLDGDRLTAIPFALAGIYLFIIAVMLIKARDPVGEGKKPGKAPVHDR
jgi:DHA1 family multidrug resistance protein-like MFS transporter